MTRIVAIVCAPLRFCHVPAGRSGSAGPPTLSRLTRGRLSGCAQRSDMDHVGLRWEKGAQVERTGGVSAMRGKVFMREFDHSVALTRRGFEPSPVHDAD